MSLEQGRFTREQAVLPEFLEIPKVKDMVTGSYGYIDVDEVLVDGTRRCWLNGDAEFRVEKFEYDDELTIVRIDEGFVVDVSSDAEKAPKFSLATDYEIIQEASDNLLPVVGFVVSYKDLLDFDKQYIEQTGQRYITKSERKALKKQVKAAKAIIKETLKTES